ncbi:MAG: phosphotransferase [archaeon]
MNFRNRLNYNGNIEDISNRICQDFDLGKFKSNKVVLQGYEDFNLILETESKKYFVKIFNNFRSLEDCQRYVDILINVINARISTSELLESKQGFLHNIKLNDRELNLCVMKYIQGKNFYELNKPLTKNQIKFLARQASHINSINIKPSFVYDSWAAVNFKKEFQTKSEYLTTSDLKLIQPLIKYFDEMDVDKLPHCFVHGDIITTNVMEDNNSNLYIVDFSVSNYYPRIQEIAVLACNLLFDSNSVTNSKNNLKMALEEYQKKIKLTDLELRHLPKYIQFAHAMHLLCANYEQIVNKNNSKENKYWLNQGRSGLEQSCK